jgi:NADH:ubiquinone oxidoreductase subunit 4 (subunit M)
LVFLGLLHKSLFLSIGSIFGLIFSAVYSLLLFNRMCCGTTNILLSDKNHSSNFVLQNRTTNFLNKPRIYTLEDITFRENFICLCFLFCILFLGLFPQSFLSFINYSILILY